MPSTLDIIKRQIREKRSSADRIYAQIDKEGRDMSPDEKTQFDALMNDVADLKTRMQTVEDAGDDDAEDAPARSSKTGVRSRPIEGSPAIHTGPAKRWSILRALRIANGDEPMGGLEGEVHQEVVKRSGGKVFKGIGIPTTRDPEIRALMYPGTRRDGALTTITGSGAIFTRPEGFIDLLRANLVIEKMGATVLTDMHGNFALVRQDTTNQVQWVNEGVAVTPTNVTYDNILFSPKLAIATSIITAEFMMQSSIDADQATEDDLAATMAQAFDQVVIAGAGGAQPVGYLNNPNIPQLPIGANGGPASYGLAVDMETAVSVANAAVAKLGYLTNSKVRGQLKKTPVATAQTGSSAFPVFAWTKGGSSDVGEVNAYPAYVTNNVPSNASKGSSTGNCSALIYGNFKETVVATWNTGMDLIVDPFSGKRSGQLEITMKMAMDAHNKHDTSFVVTPDIVTG